MDLMRRQLMSSVHAGESVTRVAERLIDIDAPIVRLPQHVRELRDAAQMALHRGDRNIYLDAVHKWRSTIERLGQGPGKQAGAHTVRSATQQLVKDLGTAKADQIEHVVERWVVERARHQGRVIARTETVEAFRDTYKETTAKQPYVVGYRWQLSSGHPRPDECFPAGTLITTVAGPTPIESLRVGDRVLTHTGRYRPVRRVIRTSSVVALLTLRFRVATSRVLEVTATPNHPFATVAGWTRADALRIGDGAHCLASACDTRSHQLCDDTTGTGRAGSLQSAPFACLRTIGAGLHAELLQLARHTGKWSSSVASTLRRTFESGRRHCPASLPARPGFPALLDTLRSALGCRLAWSIFPNDVCQSSGWPRLATPPRGTCSSSVAGSCAVARQVHRISGMALADTRPSSTSGAGFGVGTSGCNAYKPEGAILEGAFVEPKSRVTVFNLEVDDDHTFFANELLVHNCDVYAHQDVDGLGPGGYLPGNVPSSPHPHDLCSQVAIIDSQYFKRKLAEKTGGEEPPKPWESGQKISAKDWLAKQPEAFQRRLLGPTLHRAFSAGRNVLDASGKPLPVHVVLGRPRPMRRLGPPVDATGAIKRDRKGQVRPFPRIGAPGPKSRAKPPQRPSESPTPVTPVPQNTGATLADAWAKRTRDHGSELRTRTRGVIDSTLRLSRRVRRDDDEVRVAKLKGSDAQFDWSGRVDLAPHVKDGLDAAMPKLKAGTAATLTRDELDSLKTLVHEEIHGYGHITFESYSQHGRFIEECATEINARVATRTIIGIEQRAATFEHRLGFPRKVGTEWAIKSRHYDDWIAELATDLESVTGWAESRVLSALQTASAEYKRNSFEITDPTELTRQWVEAVPKLRMEQRTVLLNKLKLRGKR